MQVLSFAPMKRSPRALACLIAVVGFGFPLEAQDLGELVFSDDFDRNESQETQDDPGNGWGTNSKARAKGNKQVDLQDGTLRIFIHKEADHAVSVTHPFAFTDGTVKMRFKLEDAKDALGLNFADMDLKSVHAGHLCMATFSTKNVLLRDLKTGVMDLPTYNAKKDGSLSKEAAEALKQKDKSFPLSVAPGTWHALRVTISGDTLTAWMDDQKIGEFSSPGIAHPTKKTLRLSVPKNAVVDDVQFYRQK
jgi:hypothetical protein